LGSAVPSPSGKELLVSLAQEVGKLSNHVSVEGHTDSKPYSGGLSGYSNWELSVDRANAARRIMQSSGLTEQQVSQVRGFADQHPRAGNSPDDPANRRISLIVEYLPTDAPPGTVPEAPGDAGESPNANPGAAEHGGTKK
jgi:chemotaxis protein MotB